MSTVAGTVTYNTVVTVTAASGGDATTIAGMFNGIVIPEISNSAPVAAAVSSVVTITWPQLNIRAGNGIVRNVVANLIAANHALTAPVLVVEATSVTIT
jgi:hypothetical protein